MTKRGKILSVLLVVLICVLQFSLASVALTEGSYNVTLPNLQRKVVLISGTNADSDPARTYMTFSGGTANYIYVQVQLASGTAVSNGWMELPKSSYYQSVPYNTVVGAGTSLNVVGYQKNVVSKTASGYIYI